jgi:hypothetical protein
LTTEHVVTAIGLLIGVVGLLLSAWFGIRSIFQSQDIEALQKALRAYHQGMFNNLWRIGGNAEDALKVDSPRAGVDSRHSGHVSNCSAHLSRV